MQSTSILAIVSLASASSIFEHSGYFQRGENFEAGSPAISYLEERGNGLHIHPLDVSIDFIGDGLNHSTKQRRSACQNNDFGRPMTPFLRQDVCYRNPQHEHSSSRDQWFSSYLLRAGSALGTIAILAIWSVLQGCTCGLKMCALLGFVCYASSRDIMR